MNACADGLRQRGLDARNFHTFYNILVVFGSPGYIMESLILAQNERWRRVLSMQVVRQGVAIPPRAADW
jgi:hypothetical protein